jgi:hypothetical protein
MMDLGRPTESRSTQFAIAQGLADGEATTRTPFARALARDEAFVANFGNLEVGAENSAAATLANESSDTALVLVAFVTESSMTSRPELLRNPTNDTLTTERATRSLNFTGDENVTVATARADIQDAEMTAGDGEATGIRLTIPSGYEVLPFRAILGPGQTLGVSSGGNLNQDNLDLSVLYYETAVEA